MRLNPLSLERRKQILDAIKDAEILGIREAAAYANVSVATARSLVNSGEWPSNRRCNRIMILKENIKRWAAPSQNHFTQKNNKITTIEQAKASLSAP